MPCLNFYCEAYSRRCRRPLKPHPLNEITVHYPEAEECMEIAVFAHFNYELLLQLCRAKWLMG
jgi:hypothetical protein